MTFAEAYPALEEGYYLRHGNWSKEIRVGLEGDLFVFPHNNFRIATLQLTRNALFGNHWEVVTREGKPVNYKVKS